MAAAACPCCYGMTGKRGRLTNISPPPRINVPVYVVPRTQTLSVRPVWPTQTRWRVYTETVQPAFLARTIVIVWRQNITLFGYMVWFYVLSASSATFARAHRPARLLYTYYCFIVVLNELSNSKKNYNNFPMLPTYSRPNTLR